MSTVADIELEPVRAHVYYLVLLQHVHGNLGMNDADVKQNCGEKK